MPEKLMHVNEIIQKNKSVNFIAHDEFTINKNLEIINSKLSQYFVSNSKFSNQIYKRNFLSTSSCTVSKKLVEKYLFDPFFPHAKTMNFGLLIS